jgi:hypothetical protein
MIDLAKQRIQKLPYPLFLRIFYVRFFFRKMLRAKNVRHKDGLPLLNAVDLQNISRAMVMFF